MGHPRRLSWLPRTPQKSSLAPWDPLGIPLHVPLDPRPDQITRRQIGSLNFCRVYPWSCLKHIILSTSSHGPLRAPLVLFSTQSSYLIVYYYKKSCFLLCEHQIAFYFVSIAHYVCEERCQSSSCPHAHLLSLNTRCQSWTMTMMIVLFLGF